MKRALLAVASALLLGAIVLACAPDPGPFFTKTDFPEDQAAFNAGHLGLFTPRLRPAEELIAFRVLNGLPFAGDPSGKLWLYPQESVQVANSPLPPPEAWIQARRTLPDGPQYSFLNTYHSEQSSGQMIYFQNCLDDAITTAINTLNSRRKQYSSADTLQAWAMAQDQVFADCSSAKPTYPDPLPATAAPLARADRDYQIAAAHFYALDFAAAEQAFQAIAQDTTSPWHTIAPYLVGRTLLRQASLNNDASALAKARAQFVEIAANTSSASLAASARGLVEHIDAEADPIATMQTLSDSIISRDQPPDTIAKAIYDSSYILRATSYEPALKQSNTPYAFSWVEKLENSDSAAILAQWQQHKSTPWLVAALLFASSKDSDASDLIAAANQLPESSPAFDTAAYNAIRLHIERNEPDPARTELDHLLARKTEQDASLTNALRAERLRVATSFDDFLHWAPRKPVEPFYPTSQQANSPSEILAYDSVYVLNNFAPLTKLVYTAHSAEVPEWNAENIATAAWTRAFLLNDIATVQDLAPFVAKAHPEWRTDLAPAPNQSADEWRFRAALLIALHHEFSPEAQVNYRPDLNTIGSWWCAAAQYMPLDPQKYDAAFAIAWKLPHMFIPPDAVLSPQDRATATAELAKLQAAGSAQSALAPIIFAWASAHPGDPLVPQALARLVVVTRYSCEASDPATAKISRQAFDLLHQRYPQSPWTKQTPYWFK